MEQVAGAPAFPRKILYYPTISIPNGDWLRQAVFYFDEVSSIVPERVKFSGEVCETLVPLTPELEYLKGEGVYTPMPPEKLLIHQGWEVAHSMQDKFKDIRRLLPPDPEKRFVRVHRDKLFGDIVDYLQREDLGRFEASDGQGTEWWSVEETTALTYMSVLAQFLSDADPNTTVPGTDLPYYEKLIYSARNPAQGFSSAEIYLRRMLPVPRPDMSFADILKFKRKHSAELMKYRNRIDELQREVSAANSRNDVKQALTKFDESQRAELPNFVQAMNDTKLAIVFGSVKALVKTSSPAFWGPLTMAAGVGAAVGSIPVSLVLGGLALAGAVEVGAYLVDRGNERRAMLRESAFSYVYHARAEGML